MSEKKQDRRSETSKKNAAKAREIRAQSSSSSRSPSSSEDETETYELIDNAMTKLRESIAEDLRTEMLLTYKQTLKPKIKKMMQKNKIAKTREEVEKPLPITEKAPARPPSPARPSPSPARAPASLDPPIPSVRPKFSELLANYRS